jgi:hypothetical protein
VREADIPHFSASVPVLPDFAALNPGYHVYFAWGCFSKKKDPQRREAKSSSLTGRRNDAIVAIDFDCAQ